MCIGVRTIASSSESCMSIEDNGYMTTTPKIYNALHCYPKSKKLPIRFLRSSFEVYGKPYLSMHSKRLFTSACKLLPHGNNNKNNLLHQYDCGEYFVEYCQSHKTMLWI